jgi:hypothetical protein
LKAQQPLDLKRKIKTFLLNSKKELITLFFVLAVVFIPTQKITSEYINDSLKQAGITYLITRSINATVSIIKHSQINFNAGIGGSIAIGEALDPIDDATERFSDLLTLGIWSLGSEKVIYELTKFKIFAYFLILLALINLFIKNKALYKILIIFVFIKIFIPFNSAVSYVADKYYFHPQISTLNQKLKPAVSTKIEININTHSNSIFDKIKESLTTTTSYIEKIKKISKYYITHSAQIINTLLNLGFLYLAKFLLNIIFLPLLLFFVAKSIIED